MLLLHEFDMEFFFYVVIHRISFGCASNENAYAAINTNGKRCVRLKLSLIYCDARGKLLHDAQIKNMFLFGFIEFWPGATNKKCNWWCGSF